MTIQTLGVVGSGAMGAGIAQVALTSGLSVLLYDSDRAALDKAVSQIRSRLERMAEKGQLTVQSPAALMAQLHGATHQTELAGAQAVIEAITEKLEPKQALFAALEEVVSPTAILATNTSSLSVAAIARVCKHPERVCGMHFFNPVPLMKLVEIISASQTSAATMEVARSLAQQLQKTAVQVPDVPGFLVNLQGRAYVTEALHVRHEGVASVQVIDRIMREAAGFRMGPFELMDLTGIDVNLPATRAIHEGFQYDPRLKTTLLHESLFKAGRFGRKSGQGFHRYQDDGALASADVPSAAPAAAPPAASAAGGGSALRPVYVVEPDADFAKLEGLVWEVQTRDAPDLDILVAPRGEDASSVAVRLGLDAKRVIAVDFVGIERKFLTLMAPPGSDGRAAKLAEHLQARGYAAVVVRDSPAFVAPRILAMIANLGCEIAQTGLAAPEDIDLAMKLAQNYPRGPLEWAEFLQPARTHQILRELQEITGSDRYRPSLWLRRRAQLGLSMYLGD
jgi:3-hydroxybutyryl-CoA dehydrogenase